MRVSCNDCNNCFFIDAPGGTGKTFLCNTILAKVRQEGDIAIAVATTAIAALLLTGGRTAHSKFKIPINIDKQSVCDIKLQTALAYVIKISKVIIWNKVSMANKHMIEAVDRTFRDILGNKGQPFGGKVMIFCGDFRQILPVILR